MDFSELRKQYLTQILKAEELNPNPVDQFKKWIEEAILCGIREANSMALATATSTGVPSCRTVLLKQIDERGFVFFTNYESRKGLELAENPLAAACFLWNDLERQVCLKGRTEKVSEAESKAYFSRRPRGSQLAAWSSKQGKKIASRDTLEKEYARLDEFYKDQEIPLPPFWGGYRIIPYFFEFWQGRADRLHDRFQYSLHDDKWVIDRLSP